MYLTSYLIYDVLEKGLLVSTVSLLEKLRLSNDRWLEAILRMIYNSGGFLKSSWDEWVCTHFVFIVIRIWCMFTSRRCINHAYNHKRQELAGTAGFWTLCPDCSTVRNHWFCQTQPTVQGTCPESRAFLIYTLRTLTLHSEHL